MAILTEQPYQQLLTSLYLATIMYCRKKMKKFQNFQIASAPAFDECRPLQPHLEAPRGCLSWLNTIRVLKAYP